MAVAVGTRKEEEEMVGKEQKKDNEAEEQEGENRRELRRQSFFCVLWLYEREVSSCAKIKGTAKGREPWNKREVVS